MLKVVAYASSPRMWSLSTHAAFGSTSFVKWGWMDGCMAGWLDWWCRLRWERDLHHAYMQADFWEDFFYFIWASPIISGTTTFRPNNTEWKGNGIWSALQRPLLRHRCRLGSAMNNRIWERRHFSPSTATHPKSWAFVYESQGSFPKNFRMCTFALGI